ncbi:MAG: thiazole biosynthesis protein [Dehalococcoidia bacterium]|nr:thiazole biosynthesis protein [Dehalococcoidia bacterium]MBL7125383.1 thiazole biosynthesis protein [Dehalococcoidales bacterium]
MALFHPVSEREVTKAIVSSFLRQFEEYVDSDVIIVGGGPSGLVAGKELSKAGLKVLIIERNNYLGGGFWVGGYFMNKVTLRAPAQEILDELGVPYSMASEGLYVADAPHACSRLIAATCDAGVKFFSLTLLEDLVVRENNRVAGVVINWSPITYLPKEVSALDPIPLETKVVIDATGHDACVARKLEQRGILKIAGEGALWIDKSEDAVVERTGEVYPGLIVTGMAVASVFGLPRMGPTFGGMLLSGKRAAEVAIDILQRTEVSTVAENG